MLVLYVSNSGLCQVASFLIAWTARTERTR